MENNKKFKKGKPPPLSWQQQSSVSSNYTSSSERTDETFFSGVNPIKSPIRSPTNRSPVRSPTTVRSPTVRSPTARSPTVRSPTVRSPTAVRSSNLGYLASRRGSLQNQQVEDGEKFGAGKRRQSNFLELPVPVDHFGTSPSSNATSPQKSRQRTHRISSLPVSNMLYNPRSVSPNRLLLRQRTHQRIRNSPLNCDEDELYRLRTFNITENNQVVNCGDSFIPISGVKSRSVQSVNSSGRTSICGTTPATPTEMNRSPLSNRSGFEMDSISYGSSTSLNSCCDDETQQRYRIVLLGHSSVGKSALVSQFMTSEYINTYDVSLDDEFGERIVSVLLDGLESELNFIDHPCSEMSPENSLSTYDPHGCIVVYSVTDRHSFAVAADILRYLWQEGITQDKAVILVANKCDLERAREVNMQEGKTLASSHDAKFIETSSGIQHNVDELLVGTLKQCRLRDGLTRNNRRNIYGSRTSITIHLARELIGKLCFITNKKSKSCQNLHVL